MSESKDPAAGVRSVNILMRRTNQLQKGKGNLGFHGKHESITKGKRTEETRKDERNLKEERMRKRDVPSRVRSLNITGVRQRQR